MECLLSFKRVSSTIHFNQLKGIFHPFYRFIHVGNVISLRQYAQEGAYLHSHNEFYPEGSKQQQVTAYPHRDHNNDWIVRMPVGSQEEKFTLKHGDIIRLEHKVTQRFLHSHEIPAPISDKEHHKEISCYGFQPENISDTNDHWRIEIVDHAGNIADDANSKKSKFFINFQVEARKTLFKLTHVNLGCVLQTARKALPEWGFKQHEITCGRETLRTNSIFVVEDNENESDLDAELVDYPEASFWDKFLELNSLMWSTNAKLTGEHPFESRPSSWPFLSRGIGFWNGNDATAVKNQDGSETVIPANEKFQNQQVYMLGNPLVWWMSSISIFSLTICLVFNALLQQRNKSFIKDPKMMSFCLLLSVSYFAHYLPFYLMKRQLFLHHYLPAYYFAILSTVVPINLIHKFSGSVNSRILKFAVLSIFALVVAAVIAVYVEFSKIGYGLKMTSDECNRLKWLDSWDINCGNLVPQ